MQFRKELGAANVATLIERMSRFLVVLKTHEKKTKPIMAQIAKTLGPPPRKPAAPSPSIAGQSSWTGRNFKREPGRRPGSAIPNHPGKMAPSNMPTSVCGAGSRATPIPGVSPKRTSASSALP